MTVMETVKSCKKKINKKNVLARAVGSSCVQEKNCIVSEVVESKIERIESTLIPPQKKETDYEMK